MYWAEKRLDRCAHTDTRAANDCCFCVGVGVFFAIDELTNKTEGKGVQVWQKLKRLADRS